MALGRQSVVCRQITCRGGFTLVETLFAILLVGLSIAGLTAASLAYTQANGTAVDISTGEYLIEQIRELTATLPVADPNTKTATFGPEEASLTLYDDVDDFDGVGTGWRVISPPIDANRSQIAGLSAFRQEMKVETVSATSFATVVTDHSTNFYRVTVRVVKSGRVICTESWIRTRL